MVSQWESDTSTPPLERLVELHKKITFCFDWLILGVGSNPYEETPEAKVFLAMQHMDEATKYQFVKIGDSLAEPEGNGGDKPQSPPRTASQ